MPFPTVYGLPSETAPDLLKKIRAEIISAVAETMGIKPNIVRPFFPKDLAGDPDEGQDDTIYCRLDSGMFYNKPDTLSNRLKVTSAVAQIIWNAYNGRYEVEVFIGDLNGEGKTLLKPKNRS